MSENDNAAKYPVKVEVTYTVDKAANSESEARKFAALEAKKLVEQAEGKRRGIAVGTSRGQQTIGDSE